MNSSLQSYYTDDYAITKYMSEMIGVSDGDCVLEPCGGNGVFVDSILKIKPDLNIDTVDIDNEAVLVMKNKYSSFHNVTVRKTDTLIDELFDEYSNNGHYTKIIGNPPYGAWQDYDRRDLLKKKYPGINAKETYALFLARCINLLKDGGILSFIIPDTFLFIRSHKYLRSMILLNTKIREILIFKSNLFPEVSYGYSKMCIITLQKVKDPTIALNNEFIVKTGFINNTDLIDTDKKHIVCTKLTQQEMYYNEDHTLLLGDKPIQQLINNIPQCLGDLADCVTGICTGDNGKYYKVSNHEFKLSNNYEIVSENEKNDEWKSIEGIESNCCYIPIVKGPSKTRYFRRKYNWYIRWDKEALYDYHTFKKARFQNSNYYFKKGVAITMVKSTKIFATLIDEMVFDQSIVGIFPRDEKYLYYILALTNSHMFNELIHMINPTANNSANYVKKVPIPIPSNYELERINNLVLEVINHENEKSISDIDNRIEKLYHQYLT